MHHSQLFRKLRKDANVTVDALANKSGVSRAAIQKVERGESVRISTLVDLMSHLGYAKTSPEVAVMLNSWVMDQTGVNLAAPGLADKTHQKLVTYSRSTTQAVSSLSDALKQSRLKEADIRLLEFVARQPELLEIVRSICDLLQHAETDLPQLKVAEER